MKILKFYYQSPRMTIFLRKFTFRSVLKITGDLSFGEDQKFNRTFSYALQFLLIAGTNLFRDL